MLKSSKMKTEEPSGTQVGPSLLPMAPLSPAAEASSHAPASRIPSGSISYLLPSVLTPSHSSHYTSKIDLPTKTKFALHFTRQFSDNT